MILFLEVMCGVILSWIVTALLYYGLAKLVGYKDGPEQ